MDSHPARRVSAELAQAFAEKSFLQKLSMNGTDAAHLIRVSDWETALLGMLPLRKRLTCDRTLSLCRSLLNEVAPEPKEGWLNYTYHAAVGLLFPERDRSHSSAQHDGALCFLNVLRVLLEEERRDLPFDPRYDFSFCTEQEMADSSLQEEYRQFLLRFREEYVYELLRLGLEVTPFRTLEHIAGVHHVAMTVSRAFAAGGGLIDLALISGAAAGHDLGKFGCRPGERVPYLHYHYTERWFSHRGLSAIGRIAANHSVWDLEIENLSSESLVLVYSDFRVKQSRDDLGRETARIYSLSEAFDVILGKLDDVNAQKRHRYRFVYAKLRDFEKYLRSFGVDVTLGDAPAAPVPEKDVALMRPEEVVASLRRMAVDHNIRLMHRLGHDQLFGNILEAARGEKDWARLRAYLGIFEEYFTYWSSAQKEQTLTFLYELLLYPEGDIRRQAAALIGRILANFHTGYQKALPEGTVPDEENRRPFVLWSVYLARLIHPDRRLTPQQTSKIRYAAKLVVDSLLSSCSDADAPLFAEELFRQYASPGMVGDDAAFALLDTVLNLPVSRCRETDLTTLLSFSAYWLQTGGLQQKAAALRLLRHLLPVLSDDSPLRSRIADLVEAADCEGSTPLLFLRAQVNRMLGKDASVQDAFLGQQELVSNVFLDNLKTATPWVLKAVGVEYLLDQVERGDRSNVLHIATHFSNLIKVSENVVVRLMAGASLLSIAPALTPDRRNEIAVELAKALETGQPEISKYIPEYLGRFSLWLSPRELDEVIDQMQLLLCSENGSVVAAALTTVGAMLEYYAVYGERFRESAEHLRIRREKLAGLLLKGLASCRESVRQEALQILGKGLFASEALPYEDKVSLFALTAKKILFLIRENEERELTFFYTAAGLSHIYRFVVYHEIEDGSFLFDTPDKAAFFPGTFDPFSLSHKGIVETIRNLGFEVYLAIDEFSWSKKAQPALIRRRIAGMSVADLFGVYLFPHDIPVNLANPADLIRLREVFAGRELYLAMGSDVIANASSYRAQAGPGSVQTMNHIVFRRASDADGQEVRADLSAIRGRVIELTLPTHLEDISSSRIRENIDLGRDISNLIDPMVQDYIYRNSLYLREPQYKQLMRAGHLEFTLTAQPEAGLRDDLRAAVGEGRPLPPEIDSRDEVMVLKDTGGRSRILGFLSLRTVNAAGLFEALGNAPQADYVREHTAGRILLLTGIHAVRSPGGNYDVEQLLLTEALTRAMEEDCSYAVYCPTDRGEKRPTAELLTRQGFVRVPIPGPRTLLLADMRSPVVLIQNIPTTLKEPFSSSRRVQAAIRQAHLRLQTAVTGLYPGTLVLSLNAEVIYHRLVRKIVEANGVPAEPVHPRTLGEKMCVPFGKILRGNVVPNTVTKTIHTDKVFAPDLRSFTIEAFPCYTPLSSQIRTVRSFRRPVILVDDLLHSGARISALDPLFREEDVPIDRVLVGLLSGRGRDLMAEKKRAVDCVYFVPNLRVWFVESTLYPFIGGDTVGRAESSVPGLTPSINLILPYAFPRFYKECGRAAVFAFSRTCIENARDILLALELEYRTEYARNLTLSRLSEAVILPLAPDKGAAIRYDSGLPASACLDNDLALLLRMRDLLE